MLKGKLKYMLVGLGVLILGLGVMRYTPLAYGNYNNQGDSYYSRPYNVGHMRGSRGHHKMMWDYDKEENDEEYSGYRYHRGCMRYYDDDYEYDNEFNK